MLKSSWFAIALSAACLAQSTPQSGQPNPFVGTWKSNFEKRKVAKQTTTYERQGDQIKYSNSADPDGSYSFTVDGKEIPHPYSTASKSATNAWKQLDNHTWERRFTIDGKLAAVSKLTLSPDGKMLTTTTSGTKPNGEAFTSTSVSERTSGDTGLIGTWTSVPEKAKSSGPTTLQITSSGSGLKITSPDFKYEYTYTFDGQDSPVSGPTMPPGITTSFKRIDDHTIEETWKRNGKVSYVVTATVSADGKTMTHTIRNPNVSEPNVLVYDKQ